MRKNLFEKFKLAEKRLDHCVRFIWRQRQIIAAQEGTERAEVARRVLSSALQVRDWREHDCQKLLRSL